MVSLARKNLLHEWKRFLAAVLAVAFAGLLILVQAGLLLGLFSTTSAYIDHSPAASLWVGFPGTPSVDMGRNISAAEEVHLRLHPNVERVEKLLFTVSYWRIPSADGTRNRGSIQAFILGVDTQPQSMALARVLDARLRHQLEWPMSVVIDEADQDKLGAHVGSQVELGGKLVTVVGTVNGMRAITGSNIIVSQETMHRIEGLDNSDAEKVTFFLLGLKSPALAEQTRAELEPPGTRKPYAVWLAQRFSTQSQVYWLTTSGVGVGFVFSSVLGLIVGITITSQVLLAAILANVREYAALRALGVPVRKLGAVVVEQAGWVGACGIALGALCVAAITAIAHSNHVAVKFPWWSLAGTTLLVLLIAIFSALFALRGLTRTSPAILLR